MISQWLCFTFHAKTKENIFFSFQSNCFCFYRIRISKYIKVKNPNHRRFVEIVSRKKSCVDPKSDNKYLFMKISDRTLFCVSSPVIDKNWCESYQEKKIINLYSREQSRQCKQNCSLRSYSCDSIKIWIAECCTV